MKGSGGSIGAADVDVDFIDEVLKARPLDFPFGGILLLNSC